MSTDENKAVVRQFFEAFPSGNFEGLLPPGYRDNSAPPGSGTGPEGIRQLTEPFRVAFPDLHFAIEDQIAEGDRVAARWTLIGTHTGPLMGIPPTGKAVRMSGMSIYRFADGQMQEAWVQPDTLGLMQQLGVIPQPEGSTA